MSGNFPFEVRELPDVPVAERHVRDQRLLKEAAEFMRQQDVEYGTGECSFVTEKDVYVARWLAIRIHNHLDRVSQELVAALSRPVSIVTTFDSMIYSYIVFRPKSSPTT